MDCERCALSETFTALLARVRPFVGVCAHVYFEVGL